MKAMMNVEPKQVAKLLRELLESPDTRKIMAMFEDETRAGRQPTVRIAWTRDADGTYRFRPRLRLKNGALWP